MSEANELVPGLSDVRNRTWTDGLLTLSFASHIEHSTPPSSITRDCGSSSHVEFPRKRAASDNWSSCSTLSAARRLSSSTTPDIWSQRIPVKLTFVHFEIDDDDDMFEATKRRCVSAPEVLMVAEFKTKNQILLEALHFRGECRPCLYYYKKEDRCRLGADCTRCHICTPGEVKVRVGAMKKLTRARKKVAQRLQNSSE